MIRRACGLLVILSLIGRSRQVSGEIVYTLRICGSAFTPQVFEPGTYTVRVMDPDRGFEKVHRDLEASRSR